MTLGFPVSLLSSPIQLLQYHGPPSNNAPSVPLKKKLLHIMTYIHVKHLSPLSCKHLYHAVAASADYPFTILTPYTGADAFAPHHAVACYFLRAGTLLKTPEAE